MPLLRFEPNDQGKAVHPVLNYMTSQNCVALIDTNLIAKDGEVDCHAAVVLSKMGYLDQQGRGNYTVILPDFTIKDVVKMLSFCYTGRSIDQGSVTLSSLLVALNFKEKTDLTTMVRGEGSNHDHGDDGEPDSHSGNIIQGEQYCEIYISVVSSNNPHSESGGKEINIPNESVLMNQGNHETNPSVVHKKVKVLNPESSDKKLPIMSISYKCDYCEKEFKYKHTMLRHVNEAHLDVMFVCDSCKSEFRRKDHLENHLELKKCLEVITSTYECKNCKKLFNCPNKLKDHKRKNCARKFFCNTCLKFFKK